MLSRYKNEDGHYLLRPSLSQVGCFVISVTWGGHLIHFKVEHAHDDRTRLSKFRIYKQWFSPLTSLIDNYKGKGLKKAKMDEIIRLKYPISVEEFEEYCSEGVATAEPE